MQKYFMWGGALLIVLIVLILFITGLFPEYLWCNDFYDDMIRTRGHTVPEVTKTFSTPTWVVAAHCAGVENNLYLSFYFLALGVALIFGGYVTRR